MSDQADVNLKNISVIVNKEHALIPEGMKVSELLELRGVKTRSSVWINGTQLLLAEYDGRILTEGDVIKILRVVAGG